MSDIDPDTANSTPDGNDPSGRDDEVGIARVLRAAGSRAHPSDEERRAVRAAVHAEWRTTVAKRSQRRVWLALAASVALAALGLWVSRDYFAPGAVVASVSRSIGQVQSKSGVLSPWHAVSGAARGETSLRAGEELMTGADGRIALQLRDNVSLRLDSDTRIALIDAGHIDVKSGAVYVDAGMAPTASDHLRVGTPAGVVQHVGTQYEARIVNGGTRISVREGRVDLLPKSGSIQTASVGEQLLVTTAGDIRRNTIAPNDPQWEWAANTAPAFNIDGRPVREFLTWVGRELGREIAFADAESEAEANRAVLSGSISGLAPAEALTAVLATTQLRGVVGGNRIEVVRQKGR
jgi:ferric-dicitrate binding protein FerR (iron transport regulator)